MENSTDTNILYYEKLSSLFDSLTTQYNIEFVYK